MNFKIFYLILSINVINGMYQPNNQNDDFNETQNVGGAIIDSKNGLTNVAPIISRNIYSNAATVNSDSATIIADVLENNTQFQHGNINPNPVVFSEEKILSIGNKKFSEQDLAKMDNEEFIETLFASDEMRLRIFVNWVRAMNKSSYYPTLLSKYSKFIEEDPTVLNFKRKDTRAFHSKDTLFTFLLAPPQKENYDKWCYTQKLKNRICFSQKKSFSVNDEFFSEEDFSNMTNEEFIQKLLYSDNGRKRIFATWAYKMKPLEYPNLLLIWENFIDNKLPSKWKEYSSQESLFVVLLDFDSERLYDKWCKIQELKNFEEVEDKTAFLKNKSFEYIRNIFDNLKKFENLCWKRIEVKNFTDEENLYLKTMKGRKLTEEENLYYKELQQINCMSLEELANFLISLKKSKQRCIEEIKKEDLGWLILY